MKFLGSALLAFSLLIAAPAAMAKSLILQTQCAEGAGKNYVLSVTVPTGGYQLSVVRTTVTKTGILNIALKYTAPEVATQALETHRLRFALDSVLRPSRYTVTANGKKIGRPKPIELRGFRATR